MRKLLLFKKTYKISSLILVLLLSGCGFKAGQIVIKTAEGKIDSMTIEVFENKTHRAGVEGILTEDFSHEFSNSVEIVSSDGDASLKGVITEYEIDPISVDSNGIVTSYRLLLNFTVKIIRNSDGKVLWSESFSDYEDFDVDRSTSSTRILSTKDREWAMLHKMSRDRARIFKETVLEDFR